MMGRQNTDQGQSMPGPFHRWQGMMQGDYGRMGYGMMSGRGWGGHMMGPGMMMGRMMGPEMMIVMMDTNGDGNLSLEEFQAVHARMFKMLDKDGDGQLTGEEIGPRWSTDDSDSDD
ncbi:EF-hand domain-containing protein [Roseibium salinum]